MRHTVLKGRRLAGALAVLASLLWAALPAAAQSITALPVTIRMAPGERVAAVTVINQNDSEMSFQVRGYAWTQEGGEDRLVATDAIQVSPPLGTIPPNTTHVVRVLLRDAPAGREATYRILLDQIPPPAQPGTVRIALRLSIPIFAEPDTAVAPQLRWRVEHGARQSFLVAENAGTLHEKVTGIALAGANGRAYSVERNVSPYVLPGATRRWRILGAEPPASGTLSLTGQSNAARLAVQVPIVAAP